MFTLLGLRFNLLMELTKIKRRIDGLLDRYNGTTDPHTREKIQEQLNKERDRLTKWKEQHGDG